ncbi:MAG: hypothetical protein PHC51_05995 [bacterium]|nr:hypothetical protein [bacterium]
MNTVALTLYRNNPADAHLRKKTAQLAAGFELLSAQFIEQAEQKALKYQEQRENDLKQTIDSQLKSYFERQLSRQKIELQKNEERIQDLIINIAKEVVGAELKINPLSLKERIRREISSHGSSLFNKELPSTIAISAKQKSLVNDVKNALPKQIQVTTCPDIQPDNARLEYLDSIVELAPDKHFEEIWQSLRSRR